MLVRRPDDFLCKERLRQEDAGRQQEREKRESEAKPGTLSRHVAFRKDGSRLMGGFRCSSGSTIVHVTINGVERTPQS